ncbi:hypothetical protein TIFTF001_048260 [Ficus carica]|uniref:Response regulatory domain-containing protein n=2 Tax=Ficus carica TaxID=3494 RepID=A0AA88CWR1_FICCA|nr:hypothetical protein TIFTF001_048260 [Ficus carica]
MMATLLGWTCLEEGAEEFIVKPVKLSDVNRLKNFVMKGEGKDNQDKRLHKRKKLQDDASLLSSSPPPPPLFLSSPKLPQQHPISPSSLSSPRSSLKRPRLQHTD